MQVTDAAEALEALLLLLGLGRYAELVVKVADGKVVLVRAGRTLTLDQLATFREESGENP